MSDDKEKKRLISLNENRVRLVGRVSKNPKTAPNGKYVRAPVLIPNRRADGQTQWIPVNIDVASDKYKDRVLAAKPGDYLRATCFLVPRQVESDDGYKRNLLMLQVDDYDAVGVVDGQVKDVPDEGYLEPDDDGMCVNEVTLLGRFIQRKKLRDEGQMGPTVRESNGRKFTFVNLVYNNPRDKDADGIWIDVSVFGPQAGIAGDHLKHLDQVYVFGELNKRPASFQVKGKTPQELRISCKPYGFQFVKTGGKRNEESEPSGPDTSAYEGEDDDDLDF